MPDVCCASAQVAQESSPCFTAESVSQFGSQGRRITREVAGSSGVFRVEIFKFMGLSINGGTPIAGWFIMEHPINMGDLVAPLF